MNSILLVGANGHIGSFLYNRLKNKFFVKTISKNKNPNDPNATTLDLRNLDDVKKFAINCEKYDQLIFLVGLAHKKGKRKQLSDFNFVNLITLKNLLCCLESKNKVPEKIIFASTISVYGHSMNRSRFVESSELNPSTPYAITKLEAENYLKSTYPNKSWLLRFSPVYSNSFLININRRTKIGNLFYSIGDGGKMLSLCNMENIGIVIDGIINNKVPSGIYNVSDKKNYFYKDLIKKQTPTHVIILPKFLLKLIYKLGSIIDNNYLKENSIKLLTDNIYPSDKIRKNIDLPYDLNYIK
tara:strand:+ start:2399 stop:3292 length:894 start_codon:yes stop_codon:yes gene_type:complete